jgi:hypothetical protein
MSTKSFKSDLYKLKKNTFTQPLVSANIVTEGLVTHLDASNSSSYSGSGTTWFDLSGNGNNATLVASPTWSSTNGGRFTLNGTTQYISGTVPLNTNAFTVSFTVQNTARVADAQLFSIGSTEKILVYTGAGFDYAFSVYSPTIYNNIPRYSLHTMEIGKWYNVTVTYNNTTSDMYINGRLAYSLSSSLVNTTVGNEGWNLGRRLSTGAGFDSAGHYANLMIYNKALSAQDISKNFNSFRGKYGI